MLATTTAPPPEAYLIIFYIVILACAACVIYGVFMLIRRLVGNRRGLVEAEVEFDKLRARLAQDSPAVVGLPVFDRPAPLNADSNPLQGQELLQTEEGKQALALLRVSGTVAMTERFWVRQAEHVFVFTKSPDMDRAPAWLVRVDLEKVEAVPAGVPVDVAVNRMNSANSQ